MAKRPRRKCPVCGLYLGRSPHTGPMHDRIMAARRHLRRRGRVTRRADGTFR